jgi:tetratricopeptide (TPR) repeat protein
MTCRAFVSSTFEDLKAHRAHVIKELRRAGIAVDPMEDWTATSEEPKQFSMGRVEGCDLCVLLVGFRRGFVPGSEALSITQMEYEAAIRKGIEVLVFLGKEGVAWPPQFYELKEDQALKQWRDGLGAKHGTEFFDYDPQSINVMPSIVRWLQTRGPGAPEEAIAAVPEWEPTRLTSLFERLSNEFAIQISGGHQDIASAGSARYVDLFVQNRESTGEQAGPRPFGDLLSAPGSRSIAYGAGGSGKSTALLKLAVDLAWRAVAEQEAPIPLFARLNMFDSTQKGLERLLEIVASAVELQTDEMKRLWLAGKRPLLFLLDAYNEVAPDCQQTLAKALQELALVARHSILVTSRPTVSLDFLLPSRFTAVNIVQFTDEQIQDFLDRAKVLGVYDHLTDALKELGRNPFMLWTIAQSCVATESSELPRNKGELYRNFLDRYIFEEREARKLPAPIVFNYKKVKKPILSALALEMCRAGRTHLLEDKGTLKRIRDELKNVRSEYEGLVEVKPYIFMPESAKPNEFLDEVVTNGVMRRTDDAVEFFHHSIRDYFAAVALLAETPESVIAEVPSVSWVRHESFPFVANECRSPLYDAIVMSSGLMEKSDALVTGLQHKDPLLAAECLAAGTASSKTVAAFGETCVAMLRDEKAESRFVGCSCVRLCRIGTDEVIEEVERILFSEEEWEKARQEAIRALAEVGSDTLVPMLLRLLGMTLLGTLALDVVLAITKRIYGQPDYPLSLGVAMWHFRGSDTPIEQREGLKWRQRMYSLYLAEHAPEELVDFALNLSEPFVAALALLRLLHRSPAVKRLLEIIRERQGAYHLAMLFVPQIDANDEVASVLRHVLEDREASFSVKLSAATGLACIALQQDHALSSVHRVQISWNVRRFLEQRVFDRELPAHDRAAALAGLAKGAEHFWLTFLLNRLRDPAEDIALRVVLAYAIAPQGVWVLRTQWVHLYELLDKGDREQEFAAGLLERALEDENDFLRALAYGQIANFSPEAQAWALRTILQTLDDHEASAQSRKAAVKALGMLSGNEARVKLVEVIRDIGEPAELIAEAIQSLAESSDRESALQELDVLIAAAPQSAPLRSGRSLCLQALDRKAEALADALLAVDLSPNDARLHARVGDIRIQMAQTPEAISSYRRAVELDERCVDAYWSLAAAESQLDNVGEALAVARRAARLRTPMPNQLLSLGWYAYENGEFQESIAASRRATELDPIDAMALFNAGVALIAAGNAAEASKCYEAGIDRCFAFPESTSSIPGALGDLDKLVRSRPELESAAEDIRKRLCECEKRVKG